MGSEVSHFGWKPMQGRRGLYSQDHIGAFRGRDQCGSTGREPDTNHGFGRRLFIRGFGPYGFGSSVVLTVLVPLVSEATDMLTSTYILVS